MTVLTVPHRCRSAVHLPTATIMATSGATFLTGVSGGGTPFPFPLSQRLGHGMTCWAGFKQAAHPCQVGVTLNLDFAATALVAPGGRWVSFLCGGCVHEVVRGNEQAGC